jgi:CRP-like cAMP-binding protein
MIPIYKENLFKILTEEEMNMLVAKSELKRIKRGELIVHPGSTNYNLIYIIEGRVKIGKRLNSNQFLIGGIVHAKNFVDFKALYGNSKNNECVIAIKDTTILNIPSDTILNLLNANIGFRRMVNEKIANHLFRLENWIYSMHPIRSRNDKVINFLIHMAVQSGRKVGTETVVKNDFTQTEIAEIIGASRQTVSEVMNKLRREKVIRYTRDKVIICNFERLQDKLQNHFINTYN